MLNADKGAASGLDGSKLHIAPDKIRTQDAASDSSQIFTDSKVKVTMIEYIKRTIADFPEEIVSNKTTPAAAGFSMSALMAKRPRYLKSRPWPFTTL